MNTFSALMNLLMDTSKQAERFSGTALPNDISMDEQS